MFQTEPHVWLLDHGPPGFGLLMTVISALGTSWAYAAIAIVLAFGVRLRPALLLTLTLVTTGVAIDAAKRGFELPRPEHVDARVSPTAVVERGGASSAWSLPAHETIAATRAAGTTDWGLPSGHVASATVFVLAIRRRMPVPGIAWLGPMWIVLMALSRMALGKHFIADIVVGFGFGLAITAMIVWVERHARAEHHRAIAIGGIVVAVIALAAAALGAAVAPRLLGNFAGVTLACVWSMRNDPPRGDLRIRATRTAVAAAVYGGGAAIQMAMGDIPPAATALLSAAIVAATLLVPLVTIVPKPPLGTVGHA